MNRFLMRFISTLLAAVALTFTAFCSEGLREINAVEYRAEMTAILAELDAGHLTEAQRHVAKIKNARVTSGESATTADMSILTPIEKSPALAEAQKQSPRIRTLLQALSSDRTASTSSRPDFEKLEVLRRDEAQVLPPKDGRVDDGGLVESGYLGAILTYVGKALRWVSAKIYDLYKWFDNLFPRSKSGPSQDMGTIIKYAVIAFAAVLVGFLLRAYFRSRRFKPVASEFAPISAPASSRDADPLSRDASQWEDYAAKLNATGRHREAIRAWYHAILASLFRSGALTFRKGRTNWEYFFAFSPDIPFRREFQELTGSFEVEWYGKSSSSPDDAEQYGTSAKKFLARTSGGRNA